jgi:hypothetical protein
VQITRSLAINEVALTCLSCRAGLGSFTWHICPRREAICELGLSSESFVFGDPCGAIANTAGQLCSFCPYHLNSRCGGENHARKSDKICRAG